MTGQLAEIRIGRVAALGPDEIPSAFRKQSVAGLVAVGLTGLVVATVLTIVTGWTYLKTAFKHLT